MSIQALESEFGMSALPTEERSYIELMEKYETKSAVIRYLASLGWKRGKIAKFMNVKYQFVRNVLVKELKKS